jgi:hypothetical protein
MRKLLFFVGAATLSLACAAPAMAAVFAYSISGNGTGSLNGIGYSGPFTITGVGDNSIDLNPSPFVNAYGVNLTVTFGAETLTALYPIAFFTVPTSNVAGFVQVVPPFTPTLIIQDVFDVTSPVFATYDPTTPIGPVNVDFLGAPFSLLTNAGMLTLIGRPSDLTFEAYSIGSIGGGVPEPASWALMIAGFGVVGATMRRRPKVSVSYS